MPDPPLFHDAVSDRSTDGQRHSLPPYSEGQTLAPPPDAATLPASTLPRDTFFDVAPRSDSTSFQVGYLGLKGFRAWVKGDVLVKLDERSRSLGGYTQCTVEFKAIERAARRARASDGRQDSAPDAIQGTEADGEDEVELFSARQVLWDASAATSSTAPSPALPSTMPFSFPLTPDLPHCIHSRQSSLTYHIEARLVGPPSSGLTDAVKVVPVHLTRYTRPGPLDQHALQEIDGAELRRDEFSLRPHTWTVHSPTTAYIQLNKTIFRRAEPIDVKVRVAPPSQESVTEKGLKLRAVEADLVRIITVKRPDSAMDGKARSHADQDTPGYPTAAEEKAALASIHGQDPTEAMSSSQAEPSGSHDDYAAVLVGQEALLAHSGKLCRFHSQKPVLLRLTLHPPFDPANMPHPHPDHDALASGPVFGRGGGGGCESISQETVMHVVSFEVRIKVAILGGHGERRDIVCKRLVHILPGAAGPLQCDEDDEGRNQDLSAGDLDQGAFAPGRSSEKRAEKSRDLADAATGSSSGDVHEAGLLDFGMDDEYDGYEDVGRSLDELISEANGVDEPSSSSTHEERLEQLRQLLDQSDETASREPPPTLLESRNDLQVEVEVEGVGLAMPRHRHPADTLPEGILGHATSLPSMPMLGTPIDDGSLQPHYDELHRPAYHEAAMEEPPPPLSPTGSESADLGDDVEERIEQLRSLSLRRSGPLRGFVSEESSTQSIPSSGRPSPPPPHSPPRPSYASLEPEPSYEDVVGDRSGHGAVGGTSAGAVLGGHNEPPPYIDSGLPQRGGSSGARLSSTSAAALGTDGRHPGRPSTLEQATSATFEAPPSSPPPPLSSANDDSARPPAYGTYGSSSVRTSTADADGSQGATQVRPFVYSRPSHGGGPPGYED
ncbi:uncharacterized protein PFL1_04633 [Pseudozyma flocculosa PF-1]|uniref:Uncharacterized protein n=2 Tax=Pseudozyma flocculosa TaxID=84751 RepID=A0A5C3FBM4_9BASI|nr:uncharacterized protein PFL1_04633 [Pseudozyma flocculosa PF-1]EPQ27889.1 hypothetical protein PFL1_04633 [Pseudozyma flocculosa PF-1]SPO41670.1 uncharacterized protein PSFLO_07152 [Pseudozyma flocculosa]